MKVFAEPEWLGRNDTEHGQWVVEECEARRGIPATSIVGRQMRVPTKDAELDRVIRAHEMMHAKVSPGEQFGDWIKRGVASEEALICVEELRVNWLCQEAGFDVASHLTDGGETADGERCAATNDWPAAVRMAIATAGTASNKAFLNGVRRHNRLWGKVLLDISKRALKEMKKVRTASLASTATHNPTGLSPAGFFHTERIAEWVDRLTGMEPPQEQEASASGADDAGDGDDGDSSGATAKTHSNVGIARVGSDVMEKIKTIKPASSGSGTPYWGKLVIERIPLPKMTRGNIGRKRTASNVGRSPRRLHRLATDPDKRIFDKTTRGMGGVVIVDGSGSMSLNLDEVRQIVEASAGCTVAVYSDNDNGREGKPNFWVLADKGRIATEMPKIGNGNGVDYPAIEWAVKNRQNSRSPVVWMTDGGVCGPNQPFSELLAMQCIEYCKKNRIVVVETVTEVIGALSSLKVNRRARRTWNGMFRDTYRKRTGSLLANDEV